MLIFHYTCSRSHLRRANMLIFQCTTRRAKRRTGRVKIFIFHYTCSKSHLRQASRGVPSRGALKIIRQLALLVGHVAKHVSKSPPKVGTPRAPRATSKSAVSPWSAPPESGPRFAKKLSKYKLFCTCYLSKLQKAQ